MKSFYITILFSLLLTSCGISRNDVATSGENIAPEEVAATIIDGDSTYKISKKDVTDLAAGIDNFALEFSPEQEELSAEQQEARDRALKASALGNLIRTKVLDFELDARDHSISDEDRQGAKDGLLESIESDPAITAEEFFGSNNIYVASIIDSSTKYFSLEKLVTNEFVAAKIPCSSHILFGLEGDATPEAESQAKLAADAAYKRATDGEDFAELAKELSTGPSGPEGGDLGCSDPASFVPEFAEALANPTPEEIIEPVKTQFGWHVIKINGVEDESEDQIQLRKQAELEKVINARVVGLKITVDPEIGTWDAQSSQVTPVVTQIEPEIEISEVESDAEVPVEITE